MKNLIFLCIGLLVTIAAAVQNVGIGTSIPNAKLNESGTLKVANVSQGADKILTSDVTGLASWQPFPPPPEPDYPSVSIGGKIWMTKNLDVSTYRNGDPILKVTDKAKWANATIGAYCYYTAKTTINNANNPKSIAITYGKLYNWYAVNDPRGLAPEGWRIPNDSDWANLGTHLGGNDVAGGPLKEIGTTHWRTPNFGATNSSGFIGLPGGCRLSIVGFSGLGTVGYWWSSSEDIPTNNGWYRQLTFSDDNLFRSSSFKNSGFSVRCIKYDSPTD